MHYKVQARFRSDKAADFLVKLTNGTIERQMPDGQEIVASMQRAVIDEDGIVRWSEKCYCATPLQHERATVYDRYFTDIRTEEIEDYLEFHGKSFVEYLHAHA